jgi:sulfate transport system substrate-binding protein
MARKLLKAPILAAAVGIAAVLAGCGPADGQHKAIVLYGFSIMDEVMEDEIIPAIQRDRKERTGENVRVITSFAGSGTITNQIIFGAPAQVAMVSTEMDAVNIQEAGLIKTDWRAFPDQGTYAHTITCIVTRKGNPRGIRDFEDMGRPGVRVVYPDPTTSGGAQWAILALYGSALKTSQAASGVPDALRAHQLLKAVTLNAGSLPESARRALAQFGLGYGDALLTYENEALLDVANGKEYEIIVPASTILIEPKVLVIDRNVAPEDRAVVMGLVEFLWTGPAQEALAKNHFRVASEEIMAAYAAKYQPVELPFTVEYLGGWESATSTIIDRAWKQVQRETS